jgi:hypothetical protein
MKKMTQPKPIFIGHGISARLEIFGDHLHIVRDWVHRVIAPGRKKNNRDISFSQVKSIQFNDAGITIGYIEITFMGTDNNLEREIVNFARREQKTFIAIKSELENKIVAPDNKQPGSDMSELEISHYLDLYKLGKTKFLRKLKYTYVENGINFHEEKPNWKELRLVFVGLVILPILEQIIHKFTYWHVGVYLALAIACLFWETKIKQWMPVSLARRKLITSVILILIFSFFIYFNSLFVSDKTIIYVSAFAALIGILLIYFSGDNLRILARISSEESKSTFLQIILVLLVALLSLYILLSGTVTIPHDNLAFDFSLPGINLVILGIVVTAATIPNINSEGRSGIIQSAVLFFTAAFSFALFISVYSLLSVFEGGKFVVDPNQISIGLKQLIGGILFWVTEVSLVIGAYAFVMGCIKFINALIKSEIGL